MELEAKWEPTRPLTAGDLEALDWAPYQLGERRLLRQINQYWDTADRALRQARMSLRLRNENEVWIVTLKGGGSSIDGVHRRTEQEAVVDAAAQSYWPPAIMAQVRAEIGNAVLEEVLRIENGRHAWNVSRDATLIGELALDSGTIFAGLRRGPIHELEWEAKGEDEADFHAVVAHIGALLPLTPSNISKYQRGLALLDTPPA